jgi:hypothetical protein
MYMARSTAEELSLHMPNLIVCFIAFDCAICPAIAHRIRDPA